MAAQSIITTYYPKTHTIKASCWLGSIRVRYNSKLSTVEAHREAAEQLMQSEVFDESNWGITSIAELPDGNGYAIVIDHIRDYGDKEFTVTWTIDIMAASHLDAARLAAENYFQQRIAYGVPESACIFEVYDKDHTDPVVVDLSED